MRRAFPLCKILNIFGILLCFSSQAALASDLAGTILRDRAKVFSDPELTVPLGYMKGGKKVTLAPHESYPGIYKVLVPGKKAYIKKTDVIIAGESIEPPLPTSERFSTVVYERLRTKYVLSLYSFNSVMNLRGSGTASTGESNLSWLGLSLKGEALIRRNLDLQMLANFMSASEGEEGFTAFELGFGTAYRLVDSQKLLVRIESQLLIIPVSTFTVGDIQKNSFGYTLGAGLTSTYQFTPSWGVEGNLGMYYTRLIKYNLPAPYGAISPDFKGSRIGLGVNYQF
ncbi:MAG TPA: hypothetical protein VNJ01_05405 [Bacteriovoracaceae bacterium]|nr:hypothetical protein [Bacteriovoracaceae bacterium]